MATVLMVTNRFPKFSETFIVNKFLGLRDRGWDVHVACNRSEDDQWRLFPHMPRKDELRDHVHVNVPIREVVATARPDLVHFEFGGLAPEAIADVASAPCKIVVSFRGPDIAFQGLEDPARYDSVWQHADAVHVLGVDLWQRALRRGCPPEKPHAFIAPAIDVSYFTGVARAERAEVGTSTMPLRILSIGRLHWMKGYEYALEAVRDLLDRGLHVEYRIIGGEDYKEGANQVRYALRDLELDTTVELLGALSRSEVRDHLAWTDVLLHSAVSEGFCNAVLEAQAMAVPVVCSDAEGLPENVASGVTGLVAPRRDSRALAKALAELAGNPHLRASLGSAGRQRVSETFLLGDQLDRFERFYRSVLAAPPGSRPSTTSLREAVARHEEQLEQLEATRRKVEREVVRLEQLPRIRALVDEVVPAGATVAVISRGDPEVIALPRRHGWHFPRTPDGEYSGFHPADDFEAIALLEEIRDMGADHLVIPGTSGWWLDHYTAFRRHLEGSYRLSLHTDDCWIFDLALTPEAGRPIRRKSAFDRIRAARARRRNSK